MARRPHSKHTGAKLAAAAAAAIVMASGVHRHHHWAFSVPSVLTGHAAPAPNANAALGQRLASRMYGWTGAQWSCLNSLWSGESGWSATADTRASGLDATGSPVFAYGIPQARAHGAQVGGLTAPYPAPYQAANPPDAGGSSNARTQIRWGLRYIHTTYGTPCAALSFKQSTGNQGY